jgi:hypothetical protein
MWNLNQFVTHLNKVPVDPATRRPINAQDPANWMSRADALTVATDGLGIGFVFTPNDPYWFLDLDNCATPDGTAWQPHALEICGQLAGAAVEVSQSGRGLHLVGCGPVPDARRIKSKCGRVELYTHGRFMAEGGRGWQGDPNTQHGPALARLCAQYLALNGSTPAVATVWTTEPVPEWSGPADDDQLIERMLAARPGPAAVFGDGVTLRQLWEADGAALGRRWPDGGGREWDANAADMALAQHLAFWTGKDCERMRRLMWRSGLYREKWESRPDYVQRTITGAAGRQEAVLGGNRPSEPEPADTDGNSEIRTGYQLMTIGKQREYFQGCVYILDRHRVWTPAGHLLKPEQFRAWYGGWAFTLDTENAKVTKSAWEAFTESQAVTQPRVETVDFDPLRPSGEIWTDTDTDNLSRINAFRPRYGRQAAGDVTPIQRHLELLFPHEGDREIVTSYLAACLQLAGHKFQWCPVIQGVEGNGKTVLWRLLEYALGQEYCHLIDPRDILNPFNGWIELKLACGIEELWVHGKHEMAEALKTYITNERIPLQSKGLDQRTATNIANFLAFSNHKDAVLKTIRDRRYAMIYSAQQELADLARDGMDAPYFRALYAFVRSSTGRAAAAHWLANYPISVDVQGRAPRTTATDEAIRQSMGPAEQIVLEAVEMEEPGFQRGLIDLARCGEILRTHGRRMSPRAVGRMLQGIGYVRHPGLEASQGKLRVDGRLVKLYVLAGSEAAGEVGTDAIGRRYRGL